MKTRQTETRSLPLVDELEAEYRLHFGDAMQIALAPGRVNLVGEHTDYNDGFVFPMAIDRFIGAAFGRRDDRLIQAHALDVNESATIDLDDVETAREGWPRYVAGVAWALQEDGESLNGLNLVLHGDIPVGAGLSSSAALELSVMLALTTVSGITWEPQRMALLARKAENEYVNVSCGIMDQFVVSVPTEEAALLLDCRTLDYEQVPIPEDAVVVVLDTGVRRSLADSIYSERNRECQEAVNAIQRLDGFITSLRDVSADLLESVRDQLPRHLYQRARHVVYETLRPGEMASAFRRGDLAAAGRIMNDSHASLRDLYEVSSEELDFLVETATALPGCYGARLTGAGFGGCAIALIHREYECDFIKAIECAYRERYDYPSAFYACRPSTGASLI